MSINVVVAMFLFVLVCVVVLIIVARRTPKSVGEFRPLNPNDKDEELVNHYIDGAK